jgi:hypothetical protein
VEIDVRDAVNIFREMFPKEFEIAVLTLTNRKLEQEVARLNQELATSASSNQE